MAAGEYLDACQPLADARGSVNSLLPSLLVFDPNITATSPAGSCLLTMLQSIIGHYAVHLFVNRTDIPDAELNRKTKIPVPRRPIFLSSVLFTIFSICAFTIHGRARRSLKLSTEGAFPFCDLCYAHSCHRLFLSRYRSFIGGGLLRRTLRILNQCWGALTERIAFRFAKTIVVPSQGLARELKSAYPKLVPGKIRVIPNPVDTGAFARASDFSDAGVRDQLGIPRSALVLSFCALGNFGWKGLAIVLDALSGVPAVPVHLIVIGGSRDEVREYEAIVERLGIARTVHFVGLQNDIRPYLWASNAFIFPSIYETFPLVCLQAAAAGLPLITTPLYGVEEFMADGVTGWIVERTSGSIAFAIHSATIDRQRTAQMGQQAKERVQMYSVNRFRARWLELLDEEFEALAVRDQQRYA